MKRVITVIWAIVILTIACHADDIERIMNVVQQQLPQICQNESPKIIPSVDVKGSSKYLVLFDKQNFTLTYNSQGLPENGMWPLIETYNDDLVWNLRPDIPRDRMVKYYRGMYLLEHDEGLLDSRVAIDIAYAGTSAIGFTAQSQSTDKPLPPNKVNIEDAYRIAHRVASNWVYMVNNERYTWPYVFDDDSMLKTAVICTEMNGDPYIAYPFNFYLSNRDTCSPEDKMGLPIVCVNVSATTGDVVDARLLIFASNDRHLGKKTTKAATKWPAVSVLQNGKDAKLGFPLVVVKNQAYIALTTVRALAKGHALAAKANAKAFSLDGKQLALDAKVLNRKGVLYLPWQALNSLPGVKAQFDAKLAKLDITTAVPVEASTK